MILVEPECSAAEKKAANLVSAVVEDQTLPVGMKSEPLVLMFVEMRTVEVSEPVLVLWKVRRNPVKNHSDPALVKAVDQEHQILRRAVTAGGREISRSLIAPGSIEGMLHYREQLDMSEAHLRNVIRKLLADL